MSACEACWNEAYRQSRLVGGHQVDHYHRLLDLLEHPHGGSGDRSDAGSEVNDRHTERNEDW